MTSDRMMQAIGRIERAISRLETAVEDTREDAVQKTREVHSLTTSLDLAERENKALIERELQREKAQQALPIPDAEDPHAINPFSHDKALAALRSLDALIDDLQKARRDG